MELTPPATLLTSLQVARLLEVAPDTVRRRARLGLIPTAAVANGQRLFDREAVLKAQAKGKSHSRVS